MKPIPIDSSVRDKPPCKDCTERCVTETFNCHNSCPKDNRGERGYAAWKLNIEKVNAERRKYNEKPFVQYNPFDY